MNFWIKYIKEIFFLAGLSRKFYLLIISASIFSSFLDLLGFGIIIFIAEFLVNKNNIAEIINPLIQFNFLGIDFNDYKNVVILFSFLLILILLIKFFTVAFIFDFLSRLKLSVLVSLRSKLMIIYQYLEWPKYSSLDSSVIINNITINTSKYTKALFSVLKIISETIIITIILSYLIWYVGFSIFIFFILFIFSGILYVSLFKKKILIKNKELVNSQAGLIQAVKEAIAGIKEMKINNDLVNFIPRHMFELVFLVLIISILIFIFLTKSENVLVYSGQIVVLAYSVLRLVPSISQITTLFSVVNSSREETKIIFNVINEHNEHKHKKTKLIHNGPKKNFPDYAQIEFRKILFKNISFKYPGGKFIFENINFSFKKSDKVILTGPSGSGKTTVVDLMLCLQKPYSGTILFNDSIPFNKELVEHYFYYLPQEKFLFNDTILNNIILNRNFDDINLLSREDRASVENATNISESANFIKNFSKQYNEQIGEAGSRLSGGQKQRISLARSLFFNKDILILDESSSSLNEDLEISVNNSIQKNKERTIFCISHSIKLVKYFNVHFHLEDGKLTRIK